MRPFRLALPVLLVAAAVPLPHALGAAAAPRVHNGLLACEGASNNSSSDVFTVDPDGKRVTWLTDNDVRDGDPSWSGDGTRLAFESVRELGSEVYVMNANGSGVKRLTRNGSAEDRSTTWTRNNSKIVFHSGRDGNFEVYSMNADGTGQTNLTRNDASDALPAVSPDGKKIAFNSDRDSGVGVLPDIYVMNIDGSDVKRITTSPGQEAGPAWSPDGKQIVYHAGLPTALGIFRMNADGTGVTRLTPLGDRSFNAFPVWSPDGKRIAWSSNRNPEGNTEVYTMDASDGGNVKRVTNQAGFDGRCDWTRRR